MLDALLAIVVTEASRPVPTSGCEAWTLFARVTRQLQQPAPASTGVAKWSSTWGTVGATRNWLSGNLEEQFPVTRRPFGVSVCSASPGCHSASRNIVATVPRVQGLLAVFIAAYYVSRGCSGGRRGLIHRPLSSQHCSETIEHCQERHHFSWFATNKFLLSRTLAVVEKLRHVLEAASFNYLKSYAAPNLGFVVLHSLTADRGTPIMDNSGNTRPIIHPAQASSAEPHPLTWQMHLHSVGPQSASWAAPELPVYYSTQAPPAYPPAAPVLSYGSQFPTNNQVLQAYQPTVRPTTLPQGGITAKAQSDIPDLHAMGQSSVQPANYDEHVDHGIRSLQPPGLCRFGGNCAATYGYPPRSDQAPAIQTSAHQSARPFPSIDGRPVSQREVEIMVQHHSQNDLPAAQPQPNETSAEGVQERGSVSGCLATGSPQPWWEDIVRTVDQLQQKQSGMMEELEQVKTQIGAHLQRQGSRLS
ncbi:hypothetical protein Purlil1_12602 [Purpureocillium lilacinum]|uniref:Uncharacterized protein n=1 Tax=Purpureocillium lilacinum TaxID=33203 RepID=A0ABR0BGD9_PURLI|nr:hypothetical protein Purlil1_12602 [Purpureocillium lilacinum]